MVTLLQLSRAMLGYMAKEGEAGIGRAHTEDVLTVASPAVPSEDPPQAKRSTTEVLRDAISVLEEGLQIEGNQPQEEVQSAISLLRKAAQGEDIPISVKGIIKDAVGRTLVLRDAYSDYWDLPGGHVQEGETVESALHREIKEETGLDCGHCHQIDTRLMELGGPPRPVLFYRVEYVGGQPRCSEEHLGYQWASTPELSRINLGKFRDILLGMESSGIEQKAPAGGDMQIPHTIIRDGGGSGVGAGIGISGPGDGMLGTDTHTDTSGSGKKPELKLKSLVSRKEFKDHFAKFQPDGGGLFITGEDGRVDYPAKRQEIRDNHVSDVTKGITVLSKAMNGKPYVVAGYASPVIVDREGHRVSREALARDVPRFMAMNGRYANVNIMHSSTTVGHVLPEFTAPDGKVYRTGVDDVGFFAVAEIRTDPYAPEIVQKVIDDIEAGKLRSFSIAGNAGNPVFMCDDRQCFYDIGEVNLHEITLCFEGVNQGAKFEVISK